MPKRKVEAVEQEEAAARGEATEELGTAVDDPLAQLGEVRQPAGKIVVAVAAAPDLAH